ncbi:demethylmenaquinone methyltransferase [Virgibacillus dakarensis]|uniref:Demethylmenaquinone methyltransferase n=1 Tax=Lentibacillus populi TaxID=1827502 RepID=A0A9W5TVD3_9BACI|nr:MULTISPECIES: demethylmenaquinone methyltransferase [Bacillaceae]MBT2214269.1 demethylmenaquinone methyltransferase [Virgibacillus dakarensis]MTW85906.1 demethylmenaquinone methyltransferase [Virgibacillus dakarensis]GGB33503.1 demethylmenaquinone methyltransferase [Lentibacillus populi]
MQQSKEARVHHVFEKISNNYDTMNSIISFQRHKAWRKDVMNQMEVNRGAHALDVCCGTGDWSISLAKKVGQEGSVIGLDFSENMLTVAREKQKHTFPMKQLSFVHGNAMDLPFEDNSFDYVTIGFGLRNVPDYMTVLKEMYRVVKPHGKVVCLETSQPTMFGFRQAYYFYFRFIMPFFGRLFARSYKEYAWLHESAKGFPGKKQLKQMFEHAGFSHVQVKSYTGGVAAMHMGYKQATKQ